MSESGLYDPDDPFAQALFAAGRDETPSLRALEKTLSTVGVAAVTLSVAQVAQASSAVLPKAAVVGTLAGKVVAPVAWVMFAEMDRHRSGSWASHDHCRRRRAAARCFERGRHGCRLDGCPIARGARGRDEAARTSHTGRRSG